MVPTRVNDPAGIAPGAPGYIDTVRTVLTFDNITNGTMLDGTLIPKVGGNLTRGAVLMFEP